MKIVIIGGTGLIGSKLARKLGDKGHDVLAASPASGVNTITGEGLAAALEGAQIVVDVSNSPSFADAAVMEFFTTSGRNLMAAERAAGVAHHVAVSIVGTDRIPDSGYLRAKLAQEKLIRAAQVPFTILRSTQFFEFLKGIAASAAVGEAVHLPSALVQPLAAEDLSTALAEIALLPAEGATLEIGGPESFPLHDLVRRYLAAHGDPREVIADPHARYFGAELAERALVTNPGARITPTRFEQWIAADIAK
jgi:uncharacterized protein YbjT (DUF2867 family)